MKKKRIWYVHCKTTGVYDFIVLHCQGFDADTDMYTDASVKSLDKEGKYSEHKCNLIEINWDMYQKLTQSRYRPATDYEIYIQEGRGAEIRLHPAMYTIRSLKKAFPKVVKASSLLKRE